MRLTVDGLEALLLAHSWASEGALARARGFQRPGETFVNALIETRAAGTRELASALAELYGIPLQPDLEDVLIDANLVGRIPAGYARRNRVLPIGTDEKNLLVAIADPSNYCPLDDLAIVFGMPVEPVVAPFDILDEVIARTTDGIMLCGPCGPIVTLGDEQLGPAADALSYERFNLLTGEAAPIVRLVDALLSEALGDHASQIQMDPLDDEIIVRFRNGGSLYNVMSSPKSLEAAIVGRVKLMAGMSAERTPLAQEGRIRLRAEQRVIGASLSIIPVSLGDHVVLRLGGRRDHPRGSVNGNGHAACCRLAGEAEFCMRCGSRVVVADAIFCKDCGAPLVAFPPVPDREKGLYDFGS